MLKELSRLSSIVEGFATEKEKENVAAPATPGGNVVRDPIPVRTKGREKKKPEAPRRPITCGYCQGIGHNTQTCPDRKEKEKQEAENWYESDDGNNEPPSTPTPAKRTVTCGYCKGTGHNSQTCEVRKEKEKAEKSNENDERNNEPSPSVATPAKRSCGFCKGTGHYAKTCEVRKSRQHAKKTNKNREGDASPTSE